MTREQEFTRWAPIYMIAAAKKTGAARGVEGPVMGTKAPLHLRGPARRTAAYQVRRAIENGAGVVRRRAWTGRATFVDAGGAQSC